MTIAGSRCLKHQSQNSQLRVVGVAMTIAGSRCLKPILNDIERSDNASR